MMAESAEGAELADGDGDVIEEGNIEKEPRRGRRGKDKPPKEQPKKRGRPAGTKNRHNYADEIEQQLTAVFSAWYDHDPFCGQVALSRAPRIAAAADNYMNHSERARRWLELAATKTGPVELVIATFPICVAMYLHHVKAPRLAQQQEQQQDEAPPEAPPFNPADATQAPPNGYAPNAEPAAHVG